MARVRTHYDNLKVARDAPPEVIRAAYKTLSQKFHPDKNPSNADAAKIMAIINGSYEVLSDPDRRRDHDFWVWQQESVIAQPPYQGNPSSEPKQDNPKPRQVSKSSSRGVLAHVFRNWRIYGIAAFFGWIWVMGNQVTPPAGPKPYQQNPKPSQSEYVESATAPNGSPWPLLAGYVSGYERLHSGGLSTVTVDNSQNDSDVFVKLVSLDGLEAYPTRQFYIPAFGRFTVENITAGNYDVRYRDLSNGSLSRSEPFNLEEIPSYDGVQYSNLTMTLYKVQNGNMTTYGLSEAEF